MKMFGFPAPGVRYQDRPVAYAVITTPAGTVAVVKGKHGYFLPGGGSLPSETPEETVLREVREELGCGVRLMGQLGEAIQYFTAEGQHYKMRAIFFTAEFTKEPTRQGKAELFWLPITEAEAACFHQCHAWAARLA
ncbi:MAG TPA: NUDIX domain-containing protein [Chthonomonadaceae bacterium]|nr:NUDIX domain-containing protein [Chthonomonadaceae bacterium]